MKLTILSFFIGSARMLLFLIGFAQKLGFVHPGTTIV